MTQVLGEILFEPTFECNLRCKYCYLGKAREKARTTDWSYVTRAARRLVDKFRDEDFLVRSVLYHGAETTVMPPETFGEVCNIFHEIAPPEFSSQSIQTNGTLLTPDYVKKFEDTLNDAIRLRFSISVDGPETFTDRMRGKGTYRKAMTNARHLLKRGYRVHLFGCFTREMFGHLDEMERWIKSVQDEGFTWKFQIVSAPFNLSNEQQILLAHWLEEKDWIHLFNALAPGMCSSDGNDCVIYHFGADGRYPACDRKAGQLIPLWFDKSVSKLIEMRRGAFADTPTSPQCRYCPVRPVCNSGCPLFRVNGRAVDCMLRKTIYQIKAAEFQIPMHKAITIYDTCSRFTPPSDFPLSMAEIKRNAA